MKELYALQITPLWHNIFCSLLTVVYVKVILTIGSGIRERLRCAYESRKFVHVGAACWVIFWPLFDVSHWSWRLNILVPAVMSLKLFYKGAILADPNDIDVRTMSRSSSPSELLYGPLQFTLVMIYLGTKMFMTVEGVIIISALGIGDGLAPIIGRYYGNIKYRFPLGGQKSVEGSLFGLFLGTIGGFLLFNRLFGLRDITMKNLGIIGVIATFAEAIAPGNCDNVFIPIVLHFTFQRYPWLLE